MLTHRVHRHEMPVLSAPIPVIYSSKDVLIIDKPPSLPVSDNSFKCLRLIKALTVEIHPCGKYRHNTVMSILTKEHKLDSLHSRSQSIRFLIHFNFIRFLPFLQKAIHRLDRLTSGVVVIARSAAIAQKLHEQMRNRLVSKEYVCRVEGQFPEYVL